MSFSANSLVDTQGGGLITLLASGPVIGETEQALRFAPGAFLTTGDLVYPDIGNVGGGGGGFTIEFWFRFSANPGGTMNIVRGPACDASNFQYVLQLLAAGTLGWFVFRNTSSYGTVASGVVQPGLWHHVACSYTPTTLSIYLDGALASSGAFGGSFVHGIDPTQVGKLDLRVLGATSGPNIDYAYLGFYQAASLSAARIAEHYRAGVSQGFAAEAASSRIGNVLDQASSRAPRSIGASVRSVADLYMRGDQPTAPIGLAVQADGIDAAFFTDAGGTLRFLGSAHRSSSPYDTIQATFGDADGELAYLALELDYSDSFIANYWSLTRIGTTNVPGLDQVSQDATSISRYSKRAQIQTDVPVVSDADALTLSAAMLAKYKDPLQRITAVTFDTTDPNVAEAVLQRELMDKVRILRTPPGGGSRIQQDVFIQKIDIAGANDGGPWTVRWAVSPL